MLGEQVALVKHGDHRNFSGAEVREGLQCDFRLFSGFRVGGVADVNYDICACGFLQGGFERFHQVVRQAAD